MPRVKFLVAGGIILSAIAYLMFSGIDGSMVYYYTVPELREKAGSLAPRGVRVSGHVEPGSIQREAVKGRLEFRILDRETGQTLPVVYQGIVPDTFKDYAEVVVEGVYRSETGIFEATTLLAKCPSKYEGLGEEHPGGPPAAESDRES